MTAASYDGFNLSGTSPLGGVFTTLGVDGWISKSLRRDRAEKSQQSGSWPSAGYTDALTITVFGQAVYASDVAAATERRTLLALGGRESAALTVVDALGEGTRWVELDDADVSPVRAGMFRWRFTVTATDPTLYGPEVFQSTTLASMSGGTGRVWPRVWPTDYGVAPGVTPGAVNLPNAGSGSYHPRLRIDGGVTNPRLTLSETGDTLALTFAIPDGQWVDINAGKPREVLLNGLVSLRHLTSITGNALAVPVGGGSLTVGADAFTAAHSVSVWGYERADQ